MFSKINRKRPEASGRVGEEKSKKYVAIITKRQRGFFHKSFLQLAKRLNILTRHVEKVSFAQPGTVCL